MMRVAFLFPGQGSQSIGMGQEMVAQSDVARATFDEARGVLGWDVLNLCTQGPRAQLDQTEYTQPALLTVSIAVWRSLGEGLGQVSGAYVAGHSLGEYTALVAAGAMTFPDALRLVTLRGQLMQAASGTEGGAMAAIVGLTRSEVEHICAASGDVVAANINAPTQIVISGRVAGVEQAIKQAKAQGARGIRLAVSVPSHSPWMQPACQKLAVALDHIQGRDLTLPLVNNCSARVITRWHDAKMGLIAQLEQPLLWEDAMRRMIDLGVNLFVEVGPGQVLSGLVKKIDATVEALHTGNVDGVAHSLEVLRMRENV